MAESPDSSHPWRRIGGVLLWEHGTGSWVSADSPWLRVCWYGSGAFNGHLQTHTYLWPHWDMWILFPLEFSVSGKRDWNTSLETMWECLSRHLGIHNISKLLGQMSWMPQLAAVQGAVKTGATLWDFSVSHLALVTLTQSVSCCSLHAVTEAQGQRVPYNHSLLSSASLEVLQTERRTGVIEIVRKGTKGIFWSISCLLG